MKRRKRREEVDTPLRLVYLRALAQEIADFRGYGKKRKKKEKPKRTYTRSGFATKHATRYKGFDPTDDSPVPRGGSSVYDLVPVLRIQGGATWAVYLRRVYKTKAPVEVLAINRVFKRCCKPNKRCSKKSHRTNCAICFAAEHLHPKEGWTIRIREISDLEHMRIVDPNGTHLRGHKAQSSQGLDFETAQGFKLTSTQGRYKGTRQKWH